MSRPLIATTLIAALLSAIAAPVAAADAPAAPYRLVKTIPLGPGERWDYATYDHAADRAYVAHGDHVAVVDVGSGKTVAQIGTFPGGTHGVAIAPGGRGYTDDGKAGVAVSFDTHTFAAGKKLDTAEDADGIVYDPASGHVFVVNGDQGSISVIDPKADAMVATIAIGRPLEAAVPDGQGKLFVDGVEDHDVIAVDAATNKVLQHYPMPQCQRPHGIAVDGKARRVFATCINKLLVVVDADNGKNVATLPIGAGSDGAVFDPTRHWVVSSNGEGTLSVIAQRSPDRYESLGEVPTLRSARTIAIDPKSGRLFLPAADIASTDAPTTPGGRPHVNYAPGSLKLLVFAPQDAAH